MNGAPKPFEARAPSGGGLVKSAIVGREDSNCIEKLAQQLGDQTFSVIGLFVSPDADLSRILSDAQEQWPDTPVIGCTTAGEIAPNQGYVEDCIVAFGLPETHFEIELVFIPDLGATFEEELVERISKARAKLGQTGTAYPNEFAFLLVDGLSRSEDHLASTIINGLGPTPVFGGSAGDGTRFEQTSVFWDGKAHENAAVLTLARTKCIPHVFSLNHFAPTETRMVVTEADPEKRLVREINAEPAATELARLLKKPADQIDTFTFAESPLVVRFGEKHHVRAIKRVTEDGQLEFFSAIDVGVVLTLADAEPMAEHLRSELMRLSEIDPPDAIIGCDCILRRIEAEQKQVSRDVSNVLQDFGVLGFSTYGEQVGGLHVNQTMTGLALYPPRTAA